MNASIPILHTLGSSSGSSKNEKTCLRCGKSFWAWDTGRARCYLCVPPDAVETQRILAGIGVNLPESITEPHRELRRNGG